MMNYDVTNHSCLIVADGSMNLCMPLLSEHVLWPSRPRGTSMNPRFAIAVASSIVKLCHIMSSVGSMCY